MFKKQSILKKYSIESIDTDNIVTDLTEEEKSESYNNVSEFDESIKNNKESIKASEQDIELLDTIKDIINEEDDDGLDSSLELGGTAVTVEALKNIIRRNQISTENLKFPSTKTFLKSNKLAKILALENINYVKNNIIINNLEEIDNMFMAYLNLNRDNRNKSIILLEELDSYLNELSNIESIEERELSLEVSEEIRNILPLDTKTISLKNIKDLFGPFNELLEHNNFLLNTAISELNVFLSFLKSNTHNDYGTDYYLNSIYGIMEETLELKSSETSDSKRYVFGDDDSFFKSEFLIKIDSEKDHFSFKEQTVFKQSEKQEEVLFTNSKDDLIDILKFNRSLLLNLTEYFRRADEYQKYYSVLHDSVTFIKKSFSELNTIAEKNLEYPLLQSENNMDTVIKDSSNNCVHNVTEYACFFNKLAITCYVDIPSSIINIIEGSNFYVFNCIKN